MIKELGHSDVLQNIVFEQPCKIQSSTFESNPLSQSIINVFIQFVHLFTIFEINRYCYKECHINSKPSNFLSITLSSGIIIAPSIVNAII